MVAGRDGFTRPRAVAAGSMRPPGARPRGQRPGDGRLREGVLPPRPRESMLYTGREVGLLSAGIGSGLRRAFEGAGAGRHEAGRCAEGGGAQHGRHRLRSRCARSSRRGRGRSRRVNGLMSAAMPFAAGGAFVQGRVMPFARGGVVSQPTLFPMQGDRADGRGRPRGDHAPCAAAPTGGWGVAAAGGGRPVNVTFNVSSPDVAGFQRSQSQIAAQLSRMLARGERNG